MEKGTVYPVKLSPMSTSNYFDTGHRIRIEVSSSNFPRFDRNLNTGEEQAHATRMIQATNVVYHDKGHPSALMLPVVPLLSKMVSGSTPIAIGANQNRLRKK